MSLLLDEVEAQERGERTAPGLSTLQRAYGCSCSRAVFFRNSHCLGCNTALGYEPHFGKVFSLAPGPAIDTWQLVGGGIPGNHNTLYRRCANLNTPAGCNWLVKVEQSGRARQPFCIACGLNRTIPNLSVPENGVLWGRIEDAKRRVISALIALELPVYSRVTEDRERGLAFDFLSPLPNFPRVMTGHRNGLITLNVEEADDVKREQIRASMREPYRTLVGHFRHEVGHYYWDRLIARSHWLNGFRALFGDERANYPAALLGNYQYGPRADWSNHYLSAYASIHPWEDWAETWAHYMHMVDALGTAMSFGLKPESMTLPFEGFGRDALYSGRHADGERFLSFLNSWLKLSAIMNELSRSMGQSDFYPFAMPREAVTKLHFIHLVVSSASTKTQKR